MQNEEAMCYITYRVPAKLMPHLSFEERVEPIKVQQDIPKEELPLLYPPGFMPEWFLKGSFPEDNFDD